MQLNTGQWVVIIIAAILIFGYILGYVSNRRRAEQIFAWLKRGLSTLGTVSLGEKLPGMATGGRLEVNQPSAPLRRVEVVYVLAPRENLLFWVFHILQGRSDELIVWITYQSRPEQTIEVARPGDRQFDKRLQSTDKVKLTRLDAPKNIQIAAEEVHGAHQASKVREFVERHRSNLIRLALRPEKPHLFLRLNLRLMSRLSAEQLFSELKELAG
jgi:hypothetical protein